MELCLEEEEEFEEEEYGEEEAGGVLMEPLGGPSSTRPILSVAFDLWTENFLLSP